MSLINFILFYTRLFISLILPASLLLCYRQLAKYRHLDSLPTCTAPDPTLIHGIKYRILLIVTLWFIVVYKAWCYIGLFKLHFYNWGYRSKDLTLLILVQKGIETEGVQKGLAVAKGQRIYVHLEVGRPVPRTQAIEQVADAKQTKEFTSCQNHLVVVICY